MADEHLIKVEVVYALTEKQIILTLDIATPCTVQQAIQASGILQQCPELALDKIKVGIYSKPVTLEKNLANGDRIEIYRPLQIDPKQARILKAKSS